jgi:hypothetical protein
MVNCPTSGHWLTLTYAQRWHAHYHDVGTGHLYQGRFKSFPVEQDEHFLQVSRYVERNPLRAGLVNRAQQWRWSSLWQRRQREQLPKWVLSEWPISEPVDWAKVVNRVQKREGTGSGSPRFSSKGRPRRLALGGYVYHVLNRAKVDSLFSTRIPTIPPSNASSAKPWNIPLACGCSLTY